MEKPALVRKPEYKVGDKVIIDEGQFLIYTEITSIGGGYVTQEGNFPYYKILGLDPFDAKLDEIAMFLANIYMLGQPYSTQAADVSFICLILERMSVLDARAIIQRLKDKYYVAYEGMEKSLKKFGKFK